MNDNTTTEGATNWSLRGAVARMLNDISQAIEAGRDAYEARRTVAELSDLDDRILADIGLERDSIARISRSRAVTEQPRKAA